tara:strand:- start:1830 stop:2168 length:339 start_codon:yes stop_codon:yes gene_type:complete
MGYRSQVTLALQPKAAALFSTLRARGGDVTELIEDADNGSHNDGVESYEWNGVKWYDSYECIRAIEEFMGRLDEEDMEDQYRFIRIGEDDDDTESRGHGFEIYVTRSIEWYE